MRTTPLAVFLAGLASCSGPESLEPDYPNAAMEWRALRWRDEQGRIPEAAWSRALRAREALVAETVAADDGGIAPQGWVERGPFNVSGRSRALAIDPRDPRVLWSGGVSGGLWKSTDRGASWSPVDDWWSNLAIACIVLDPSNPDVMYVGTGEGFFNDHVARGVNRSAVRGGGILKSADGGAHWSLLPSTTAFDYVQRIAVSSSDPNILLASVRPGGVYRSADAGATWTQVHAAYASDQVLFDPNDGQKALAHAVDATLALHSVVWSQDAGLTWNAALSGLTAVSGYDARIEMCYARGNPGVVYASCGASGGKVWRSSDGGRNWTQQAGSSQTGVTWYFNGFWVDPTNENLQVASGLHVWRSTDGGVSFTRITNGYIMTADPHLDVHSVVADPGYDGASNRRVYVTTDGGLHVADDILAARQGSGWRDLDNGLRSTQFYGADGHAAAGLLIGGTQDNGTQRLLGSSTASTMTFGGDGGQVQIDPTNPSYVYGEYVWCRVHRSSNGGASASFFYNGITETTSATANFIAPIALDPNLPTRLYAGATRLWRTNSARSPSPGWAAIKPAAGAFISAIAVAEGDSDLVWVGHNDGELFKTSNATASTPTWIAVDDNGAADPLPNRYVTRIQIDARDHSTVWISLGGFASGNVRVTRDGGATFRDASGTGTRRLPDVPVNCVVLHPDDSNAVYAATEVGIFASDDAGAHWSASNDGPANVATEQLVFVHGNRTLLAATLGRGLWTCEVRRSSSSSFGTPCAGSANPPILGVDPLAPMRVGREMRWIGTNLPPGAAAFLVLGLSDASWSGGSLPFDLSPLGLPGCSMLVSPDAWFFAAATPSGEAAIAMTIPGWSQLVGATLHGQMAVQDASRPGGLSLSAGVHATAGY
ncbi:MAG: exo-alpha-sialidase [Planctomycetota bacterium]